jgi:hypothetical protein
MPKFTARGRSLGNIYKRLQKDLQPVPCQRPDDFHHRRTAWPRVNSGAQTTCIPKSKHAERLLDDWHSVCFFRGSVEEWDGGLGQTAGGCITAAATGTTSSR